MQLTRIVAALLVLVPAATATACGNAMLDASIGPGFPYFWLAGVGLHVLTLPFLGRHATHRLLSLAAMLALTTAVGIAFDASFRLGDLWLGAVDVLVAGGIAAAHLLMGRSEGGPRLID